MKGSAYSEFDMDFFTAIFIQSDFTKSVCDLKSTRGIVDRLRTQFERRKTRCNKRIRKGNEERKNAQR